MHWLVNRRCFLSTSAAIMTAIGTSAAHADHSVPASARLIVDNDFGGDPDGLFQLAHHLLCPSVDIPIIISSHLPLQFGGPASASAGVAKVRELLSLLKLAGKYKLQVGAEHSLVSRTAWAPSPASAVIIREALRDDTQVPLVYAAGAGLTELALAWLAEPKIGQRLKLVWIGGREHPGLASPPPGPEEAEFNFAIDPLAAQIIFNESDIEIWQVPRDIYRQMLFTAAEMDRLAASSMLGQFLGQELKAAAAKLANIPGLSTLPKSEVYILGDSPLVTLTALMAPIQPDPSSSRYILKPTPHLMLDGTYQERSAGRPMRVYTSIDSGLTIRDMIAKFNAATSARSVPSSSG